MFFLIAPNCLITPTARIVNMLPFYGSSVIVSEDGSQQGDPGALTLFAETIQTLVKTVGVEN